MSLASRSWSAGVHLEDRFADIHVSRTGSRFTLYEARDPSTRRTVAIKTPAPSSASWVDDALDHEGSVLAAIGDHPNIVTLFQRLTLHDGRPALVLARCSETLDDALHTGERISHPAAVAIGIRLASALETAHQAGIVHRDVRPSNVLVGDLDEPVLSGFDESVGLGSAFGSAPLHVTTPNTAPELLEGGDATPASDVYGLAALVYELIAGRTAFRAYAGESPAAVIVRVLTNPVRPIIAPDVPLELSDLLTWGMAADPAKRPPSPAWIAEELARIAQGQGWTRTPMTVG